MAKNWRVVPPALWRIGLAVIVILTIVFCLKGPIVMPGLPPSEQWAPASTRQPTRAPASALPILDPADHLALAPDTARLSNAQVPIVSDKLVAALPFRFAGDAGSRARAVDCLALAALYEAGDDAPGERAVIQVVLNRTRHPAFPKTVCSVVFQGSERVTGCQFTFACDGALTRPPSIAALARARAIAGAALAGQVDVQVGLATHYHADYVVPRWRDKLAKIAQLGPHIFYRWPGFWGSPAALSRASGTGVEPFIDKIASLSPAHAAQIEVDASVLEAAIPGLNDGLAAGIIPPRSNAAVMEDEKTSAPFAVLKLNLSSAPGSYALKALELCRNTASCQVRGIIEATSSPDVSEQLGAVGPPALGFLYVRKASGSAEGVYWDCNRFKRENPAECLPTGSRLERLLAG